MNRRTVSFLLIIAVLLSTFMSTAVAQSDTKVVALGDRYQIRVPEDWTLEEESDGSVSLIGFGWAAYPYQPDLLTDFVEIDKDFDAIDVLRASYSLYFSDREPAARDVEALLIDGRDAAVYITEDEIKNTPYEFRLYAIQASDKAWGMILVIGEIGYLDEIARDVDLLLASFDVAPSILRDETADARGLVACTVGVSTRDTARLRVGPGENRTAVAFLPVGDGFTVTGRFVADDGGVWYQLDKDETAPQSAAAEIWVSADEVDSDGDCDLIGDASAPPIVPIIPNSGGGSSGGSGGGSAPPSGGAVTGIVPLGGFYTFTIISVNADASCEGTGNVQIPVAELYEGGAAGTITVLNGGAVLHYNDNVWVRAADGSGFYTGDIAFAADSFIPNGVVYLNVVSTTELRGTLVSNFTFDGVGCSDTVSVVVRRS